MSVKWPRRDGKNVVGLRIHVPVGGLLDFIPAAAPKPDDIVVKQGVDGFAELQAELLESYGGKEGPRIFASIMTSLFGFAYTWIELRENIQESARAARSPDRHFPEDS